MAHYGEQLDVDYNPAKDNVYSLFAEYFGNPVMTKTKDVGDYSMYMSKVHALLLVEHRYIIAFLNKDDTQVGEKIKLSELPWVSFQTRSLTDEHDLPYHSYTPRRLPGLSKTINRIQNTNQAYVYNCDGLPVMITLIPKDKTSNLEYNPTGTLVTALETYNTIVSWR